MNAFKVEIFINRQIKINKLKVDQSFVRNMVSNANDASITKTVILLGQSFNLKVIAEGEQTAEQLEMLKEFGCDEVQGYCSVNRFLLWIWKNSCLPVNFLAENSEANIAL